LYSEDVDSAHGTKEIKLNLNLCL